MLENFVIFVAGVVVGVIHHAYLQPKLAKLWKSIQEKAGGIGGDSTGG